MLKRTSFEKKVIGLLVLVILFVSASAVLVYVNLRNIVNEITEEARPDEKLIVMKEMLYDISDAENSVKSYSLTKDPAYLEQFDSKTRAVDSLIQELRELSKEDGKTLSYVDSLDVFTKSKFIILEDLLILQEQYDVDGVLEQVIRNIETAESRKNKTKNPQNQNISTQKNESNTQNTENNSKVRDESSVKTTEELVEEKEEEKKGFFDRLKERRRKKKEAEENDEAELDIVEEKAEENEEVTAQEETAENNEEPIVSDKTNKTNNNTVSLNQLERQVNRIRDKELENERELKIQELMLIQEDKLLMDRIMGIFDQMEINESSNMETKLLDADEQSQTTKYLVAAFCLLVTILLIFAAYAIFTYVKRNDAYKKALKAAKDESEMRNREVMDSIHYAQRIQTAILPDHGKIQSCIPESFILYKPKDIVAGDFYWMVKLEDKVLLAVADCTGHGVPGAMVSVVCHNALNRSVREFGQTEPAKILEKTRELVIETLDEGDLKVSDGMDIALCSIDTKSQVIQYAGANNSLYLLKNNAIHEVKPDKQPVGRYTNAKPFTNHEIKLNKGDQLYLFTDGLADQFGGDRGKKFKYKQFKELIIKTSTNTLDSQRNQIDQIFEDWKGNLEQVDDVCVVGVRF